MKETIAWAYGLFAFLAITLLLLKLLSKSIKSSNKRTPPSPPKLPILGHLHLLKEPRHRCLQHLSKVYGPLLYLSFGSMPVLVIQSPSLVEECFKKHDLILSDRPQLMVSKYLQYNSSTLAATNYGSHWRNLRRLTTVELLSTARLNTFSNIRQEEVKMLVKNLFLSSSCQDFSKVEMRTRLSELTFNIITRMITGKRYLGTEVENSEETKNFLEIIRELFYLSGASNLGDYIPILRLFDCQGLEKRLATCRKKMDVFSKHLINEYKMNRDSKQMGGQRTKYLIDTVLSLQESEPEYYSDEVIQGLIMLMITAGTDTSAVTIEWAMSLLLNHPNVLAKARAEIDENVVNQCLVNEKNLPKLTYLNSIINETFRLFPAAPLLGARASSDTFTVCGYTIPKGTMVIVNAWGLHRDPDVWQDPNDFKPERFHGLENTEMYKLIPFGVGRRICPGAGLASRVVGLALATVIQCFEWRRVSEQEIDMTEGTGFTMPKLKPLEVMCKPRESMIKLLSQI